MIRAVMLFRSGSRVPKAVSLANQLKMLKFVTDAYAVYGRFDIVVFLEGENEKQLLNSFYEATKLEGIMSSETLIDLAVNDESKDYGKGPFDLS
ncbi:MAG: hypothetical protein ABSD49_12400 [Candidatus Bathyarchaeia archaeon]|jgi:uncharacterized protein with GYD domain